MPTEAGYGRQNVRAALRQSGEYRAAIPADIASLEVSLPSRVLADAEEASQEIVRFDTELGDEIAPFASVLLRSESAASSKIENLTASARAIAEAETLGNSTRRNAALIVANTEAMQAAVALADQIDGDAIQAMHAALMSASNPNIAGGWRTEQVWIGGGDFGPRGADFIPPHHSRVPRAIDGLIRFARRDDIPVLPQIAIAHAQFETIHPFPDGNGRAGRALIQAMLRNKRLTRQVTDLFRRGYSLTPIPISRRWAPIERATPRRSLKGSLPRRSWQWATAATSSVTYERSGRSGHQ